MNARPLAIVALFAAPCLGQTIELVQDLNQTGATLSSEPTSGRSDAQSELADRFVQLGGVSYLLADHPETGRELWRTDGTTAGTWLVVDLWPGTTSSSIQDLTVHGGKLWFVGDDGAHGPELFVSDGTAAGTQLIKDLKVGPAGPGLDNLTGMGGHVYFTGNEGLHGIELWRTDGTAAGTSVVADLVPGILGSFPRELSVDPSGTRLLFTADDGLTGREPWVTDGTGPGTQPLGDLFAGAGSSSPEFGPTALGRTWFHADDGVHGRELWSTDGTPAGTSMVLDLDGTAAGSDVTVADSAVLGGALYFTADGGSGIELWSTDGTAVGTSQVVDLHPAGSASPGDLVAFGGLLYFAASDGTLGGRELFRTDGTAAGTGKVHDFFAVADGLEGSGSGLVEHAGYLYLRARSVGWSDLELWRTDGVTTTQVADLVPGAQGALPDHLTPTAAGLLFTAEAGGFGRELWLTDGTSAGTALLADASPGTEPVSSRPSDFLRLGDGRLLFVADDGVLGEELYRVDPGGTTSLVLDIYPGPEDSDVDLVTTAWNQGQLRAFFTADDGVHGFELWVTDGTTAGTILLDAEPTASSGPSYLVYHPPTGLLFFSARHPTLGVELYVSDGTPAGTKLLVDLRPGSSHGLPSNFTPLGDKVVFRAYDSSGQSELHVTDGTATGTQLLKDINPTGSSLPSSFRMIDHRLAFTADDGVHGRELWVTDGTAAGTWIVADIMPGPEGSDPSYLYDLDGQLYLRANDGLHGEELWTSDLTAAGTVLLKDLNPGSPGLDGEPGGFIHGGDGWIYFQAKTVSANGFRFWRTDGTAAGTTKVSGSLRQPYSYKAQGGGLVAAGFVDDGAELYVVAPGPTGGSTQVADLLPGPLGSGPSYLTHFDGVLYFAAYLLTTGDELYRWADAGAHVVYLDRMLPPLELRATDPVLGSSLEITAAGWSPSDLSILLMSGPVAPSASPLLMPGQVSWIDLATLSIQGVLTGPYWQTTRQVPAMPALAGGRLNLQVWSLPGFAFPARCSNGIQLVLAP